MMTAETTWQSHALFPSLHSWSPTRSSSRLQPTDLLYTCDGIETGELGCLKNLRIESLEARGREDKCTFGHLTQTQSKLVHSWDVSDSQLGTSAQRITTLSFTFNLSEAVPFSPRKSGLPSLFAERAEADQRNPWWTVMTSRGPIAFDTVTALELAFGISSRLASMLFSPFLGAGLLHWRSKGIDHLWLRAPLPPRHNMTRNEATCASYWLREPWGINALEATRKSLMDSGPLRMPRELDGIRCDASGICLDGVVFVQAFALAARKATFPRDWDSLVVIDNAQTLHGGMLERNQEDAQDDAKRPQVQRRALTCQQVQAALDSRNTASSVSSELSAADFELLPDNAFDLWGSNGSLASGGRPSGSLTSKMAPVAPQLACEMLLEEFGRTHKLLLHALNLHSTGAKPTETELAALWEECSLTRVKVFQIQERLQLASGQALGRT